MVSSDGVPSAKAAAASSRMNCSFLNGVVINIGGASAMAALEAAKACERRSVHPTDPDLTYPFVTPK